MSRWLPRAVLALIMAGGGVTGCAPQTRYQVLSTFVDGVPAPGEERRSRRRRRPVVQATIAALAPSGYTQEDLAAALQAEADPLTRYATFQDVVDAFPGDAMGNPDWVAGVEQGLLDPRPGIDDDAPDIVPMPLDVHLDPGVPLMEVVFPHEAHTYWLRCDSCHPSIFKMKAGANPITMAKIFSGEYCGRCHGKVAFAPETSCARCHVRLAGGFR